MIERDVGFKDTGFDQGIASPDGFAALQSRRIAPLDGQRVDQLTNVQQLKSTVEACIGEMLVQVEDHLQTTLSSKHAAVQALVTTALSMGGKRLRPMLTLLSSQSVTSADARPSARDRQDLTRIAAAVELVHTASLAHDDVMDHAENRRHQPTICKLSGNSAAILLGDFLFTKAYAAAACCRSPLVARRIAAASTQLCEGELRQQLTSNNWNLTTSEYYSILIQKTASLCSTSCRLGAWQVGAPEDQQRALQSFGKMLGLAFQVYDDWLDYWGGAQTGKTLGTDLAQRKPTLPLLNFLRMADEAGRKRLLKLLASDTPCDSAEAIQVVRESEAGTRTLATAQRLAERALKEISLLPESPARSALASIARFSVQRSV